MGRFDEPPRWDDPAIRRLMDATSVTTDEGVERRFPDEWGAEVRVTAAGETHERSVRVPLGEPEKPMSETETRAKVSGLLADTDVDPERLTDAVTSLTDEGAERGSLASLVDAATVE